MILDTTLHRVPFLFYARGHIDEYIIFFEMFKKHTQKYFLYVMEYAQEKTKLSVLLMRFGAGKCRYGIGGYKDGIAYIGYDD